MAIARTYQEGRVMLHAGGGLAAAAPEVKQLFGQARRAVFVPYALHDHEAVTARMSSRYFDEIGVELVGLHTTPNPADAIADADALVVGGGNTFRLLKMLEDLHLLDPIREAVARGVPYFGASAGANVAGLSIRTTNDMPIVQPASFAGLGLVPLQINPHYVDSPPGTVGETREVRLAEFLEENDVAVLGLREDSWLLLEAGKMQLRGPAGAVLLRRGHPARRLRPGQDLSALLRYRPRFDAPS